MVSRSDEKNPAADWSQASLECDVIMKGGVTSGVIYPGALVEFAKTYKFRGVGGASAGAIGAAFAAAAELGRGKDGAGFDLLGDIPRQLGGGGLLRLFQAQPTTKPILSIFLRAQTTEKPNPNAALPSIKLSTAQRIRAVLLELQKQFPGNGLLGAAPGAVLFLLGVLVIATASFSFGRVPAIVAGVVVALFGLGVLALGWAAAMVVRMLELLTTAIPANEFGICRGLSAGDGDGLTEWLSQRMNQLADMPADGPPLTFGMLWGDADNAERDASARTIDLRMISTCLSRSRPYELPWDARNFFYEEKVWRLLFPGNVMNALAAATPAPGSSDTSEFAWMTKRALARGFRPLPQAADLPVVVATRMSLSFPVLLSAIPLKAVDFGSATTQSALKALRQGHPRTANGIGLDFNDLWFTDGGLCSNFPLNMFDSPLPTRPTFAINLGRLPKGQEPSPDQLDNIEFAKSNLDGLLPSYRPIATKGVAAVGDFALAALDTARNWQDNSYLDVPGFRDRIVRVNQSAKEGGLNLDMQVDVIDNLSDRGRVGANALVTQFTTRTYSSDTKTGWQNHRWIRYRALLAAMPDFVRGYRDGRAAFDEAPTVNPARPPALPLKAQGRNLGASISDSLIAAAAAVDSHPEGVDALEDMGRAGRIRRVPEA